MNRLTKRTPNGIAYMAIADTLTKSEQELEGPKPILEGLYAMFQKLADYEDKEELPKGQISDGNHSFDELYYHRMVLFALLVNRNPDISWKSWKHHDGTMYEDYFIVGINTPDGQYSYHYHKNHWYIFAVNMVVNAPEWDGHQPKDIDRLFSLLN